MYGSVIGTNWNSLRLLVSRDLLKADNDMTIHETLR